MTSAFAQGFQMGSEAWDNAERMKLARAAEERANEQFGWQREEQRKKTESDYLLGLASQERGIQGTGSELRSALEGLTATDTGGTAMNTESRDELATALNRLSPEQAQLALRAYGNAYGGDKSNLGKANTYRDNSGALMVTEKYEKPSAMDSAKRYEELAAQSGNMYALKEARANRLTALQISGAQRQEDQAVEFQKVKDDWNKEQARFHDDINSTMETDGVFGVVKKYGNLYEKETGNTLEANGKNVIVKKGKEVIDTIPASEFGGFMDKAMSQYYVNGFANRLVEKGMFNSPQEAINYMTKQRELANQTTTANAAKMNAETQYEFHKPGGVWQQAQNAHNQALKDIYAEKQAKPQWRTVTIKGTVDANGVKGSDRQIIVGMSVGKDGTPKVQAYTPEGKEITDQNTVNAAMSAAGGEGMPSSGIDSSFSADLGAARKRYENGQTDLPGYQKEVAEITLRSGLPKPGQPLNPAAGKQTPETKTKTALPEKHEVHTSPDADRDIHFFRGTGRGATGQAGWRVDGVQGVFPSESAARKAWLDHHYKNYKSPMNDSLDKYPE